MLCISSFRMKYIFLCLFLTTTCNAAFFSCVELLMGKSPLFIPTSEVRQLREELAKANALDQSSGRRYAQISNFVDRSVDFNSSVAEGSHIVSLGSGPDVFLPFYAFPTAKHLHLIDNLGGWGDGPHRILAEIELRLTAFAPDAKVVRTGRYSWKVNWISPSRGPQEKFVWLHPMHFRYVGQPLIDSWADGGHPAKIGGLIVTGVNAGKYLLELFLSNMIPGGILLTEMNSKSAWGELLDPESPAILEELSKSYDVYEFSPIDRGYVYTPHTYVIGK